MMLKDRVALIYGASGDVGGAVSRAFAREGAKLFLSGRNLRKVEAVAADVVWRGGVAEASQVDLLQRDRHLQRVAAEGSAAGGLGSAVCASHHHLYAGAFPHGADRGAPVTGMP
jgi:NAD(P)-dependent dehydrogenase (short-subunit alcohol dehydrogenase family)